MKRQAYYPSRIADQVLWLMNLRAKLPGYATLLGVNAGDLTAILADINWLLYVLSDWLTAVRAWTPATTAYVEDIQTGTGTPALPVFVPPTPEPGTATVAAGVLDRIFGLAATLRTDDHFTDAIGTDLMIIGSADTEDHPVPKFLLKNVQGDTIQSVNITFYKYGHMGVYIESRRGGGAWEFLAIDTESPYLDDRPLLAAGQPEVREYRMRFWDKGTPNGEWTDMAKITVAP
jgi:hypothetical protein